MNEVPTKVASNENVPTKPQELDLLAKRANEAHKNVGAAARNGLACAFEAGQALLFAKKICPVGKWLSWLAANFHGSRHTARRYMNFARECDSLGGLDGSTLIHITPQEAGSVLKKLLVLPSGKRTKASAARRQALPSPRSAQRSSEPAEPVAVVSARIDAPLPAAALVDPFVRWKQLLSELIEAVRVVKEGDDSFDGPLALMLLDGLEPLYADLLEIIEVREEHKGRR